MTETFFECKKCYWCGQADELVDNEGSGKYDQCPRCGRKEIYEEEE